MKPMPWQLRLFLSHINLFAFNPNKPLQKTRGITNWFMGFVNRWLAIKTTNFYSEEELSFTSNTGHRIPLRIFTPKKTAEKLPIWLYIHGGGFAHGTYRSRSNFCKHIAMQVNCIVVSVEYRLAPEHPFPAAPNDCFEALQWISYNADSFGGDGSRIAVGGESAGGNLSAVLCLMARDKDGPKILHQTLLYPATDARLQHASLETNATGYMLTKDLVKNFRNAYLPEVADRVNPYASPLLGDLHGLPPALVITAGYDPLCDEGIAYVQRLNKSGVQVTHRHYPNMIHDFTMLMMRVLPESKDSVDLIVKEITNSLHNIKC